MEFLTPQLSTQATQINQAKWLSIGTTACGRVAIGISAHGIVAIGVCAHGVVSIGVIAMGIFSAGLVSMGLLSAGFVAMGLSSFSPNHSEIIQPHHPTQSSHQPHSF